MQTPKNSNHKSPKLIANDVFGNKVSLVDHTHSYTLLVFLRYSGCPWCNLAIHRLTIEYPLLKAGSCEVVAIVQSEKEGIMENIYNRHDPKPQFPIIADHEMKFYKQFDVSPSVLGTLSAISEIPYWLQSVRKLGFKQKKLDGNFFLVPAWFLINNESGEIVKSEKGVSFYNHATFTPIYESLNFKE
jgi:peroxiredoxin